MVTTRTLEQIEADLERTRDAYDKKFNDPTHRTLEEFEKWAKPEILALDRLSREKRMMMPYKLSEIPDFADIMTLKDFVNACKSGCFSDYDGSGNYILDGKETNITIYPSDIKYGTIRWEFDSVAWYNK
jgi:hypothetical protein